MRLRSPMGGFAPSVLLACVLFAPVTVASQAPFVHPAAPRDTRSMLPPATGSGARAAAPLAAGDAVNGTWQEFSLLQVAYAFTVQDPVHDQLLSLGGYPRTDHWALPLADPLQWQPLPAPASPQRLEYFSSAQDPATGLVYFLAASPGLTEIKTLDPQTGDVAAIAASGTPPPWLSGALVFDAAGKRLIVYGSIYPYYVDPEVWVLDLLPAPTWSRWTPSGDPPPGTVFQDAVVDPVRRRIVFPTSQRIWALTLDGSPQWLRFMASGPLPSGIGAVDRPANAVVYDPVSDRLWIIDRQGKPYSLSLETYEWSPILASGPCPSPRRYAGIAIDRVRHRLLVSGGWSESSDKYSDTWALSLEGTPAWTLIVPDAARPPIRVGAGDGYDASRHRLVVFGGFGELVGMRSDTWVLDLGPTPAWSPLETQGIVPPWRYLHASAWDDARDQLVVFGGNGGNLYHPLADLWALSFAGATPTWSPITPAGPAPPGRRSSQMVYDSSRDRFLLIDGNDGAQALGDVWELRLSATPVWRQLAPTGLAPTPRGLQMCVYDPAHDRVLMFGGEGENGLLSDLWALNLGSGDGAWQELSVPSGPSRRSQGLLRLDSARDRLLLFGGYGLNPNDTWALNLAGTPAWQELSPAGSLPPGREGANGAYDPIHNRLVLTCGGFGGSNDLWTLSFGDVPTPVPIQVEIPARALSLSARASNGRASFTVELPSGDPATLALFDVAGRSVWSRAVGELGAGSHEVSAGDAALPAALYFARLTQGQASRFARVAIVR